MIDSVFILNETGEILAEKHWRGVLSRSICDTLLDAVSRAECVLDVPPVLAAASGRHQLFHVTHFVTRVNGALTVNSNAIEAHRQPFVSRTFAQQTPKIHFVAVCGRDTSALVPLEFLNRLISVMEDYFGLGFSEDDLRDEFVRVYQILDDAADNGTPACTEPAIMRTLVPAPDILDAMAKRILGTSARQEEAKEGRVLGSSGQGIVVPWRRTGIKYTSNEFFVDIVEDVDCIVDPAGKLVTAAVSGSMYANCRLSGMPDLTLTFQSPSLLDDVSLHPCVRVFRWEKSRVISFVPPDGRFTLLSYRVRGSGVTPPVNIYPSIKFEPAEPDPTAPKHAAPTCTTGKLDVSVQMYPFSDPKQTADGIIITIPLPRTVTGVVLSTTAGSFEFDSRRKVVVWTIGKWNPTVKSVSINGTISLAPGSPLPEAAGPVSAQFRINMFAASGVKVAAITNSGESYKFYKGTRSLTRAGQYFFRA